MRCFQTDRFKSSSKWAAFTARNGPYMRPDNRNPCAVTRSSGVVILIFS